MNDGDKMRFAEIMAGMADNFGDEISRVGLKLKFEILKNYSIDEIEVAAVEIIKTRIYNKMPTVAEIIEKIEWRRPKVDDLAQIQAAGVIGEIRRVGASGNPRFDDKITRDLFKTRFNFKSLCMLTERELIQWEKIFLDLYKIYHREAARTIEYQKNDSIADDGRRIDLWDREENLADGL